ncbi:MAG TPA: LysM peptidoglycan-binding domain-containing protein [Pseudonocardia sp.]|jgi:hypothetical protein|nr:LysM peptidoglycan-binding domain-containing protein [Pseudonocardia sp.]
MGGSASSVRVVPVEELALPVGMALAAVPAVEAVEPVEVPVRALGGGEVRRLPARRIGPGPEPTGPGRAPRRPVRGRAVRVGAPVRRVPAGRASAARPVAIRPVPLRARGGRGALRSEARYATRRAVAQFVLVCVAAALVVGGLGLLGDVVRTARVPSATGMVQVHAGESLWQVARRVAPSADPGAVAARIVELNDLGSPSVRSGQVVVSPIG